LIWRKSRRFECAYSTAAFSKTKTHRISRLVRYRSPEELAEEATMPFRNRSHAGRKLAKALVGYKAQKPVVLALPRGGVSVAGEVCAALNAPLDLILVRKIGVPFQPELAMGAVVDGCTPIIVRNEEVIRLAHIDESTFKVVCDDELAEIERQRQRYLGTQARLEIGGCTAIVIDDGIATGATMRAALRATRTRNPKKWFWPCR